MYCRPCPREIPVLTLDDGRTEVFMPYVPTVRPLPRAPWDDAVIVPPAYQCAAAMKGGA